MALVLKHTSAIVPSGNSLIIYKVYTHIHMQLEKIILIKVSLMQKDKCHMPLLSEVSSSIFSEVSILVGVTLEIIKGKRDHCWGRNFSFSISVIT